MSMSKHTCIICRSYRPGNWPDCIMAAFCSCQRCPNRSELLRNLSTQRKTQPSSRDCRDLVVKSCTQSSKQRCTSLPYICSIDGRFSFHSNNKKIRWDACPVVEKKTFQQGLKGRWFYFRQQRSYKY